MENLHHNHNQASASRRDVILAWSVHLFTATGAVWALLSILAIQSHNWRMLFLMIAIAIFVDGFDGMLARRFHTKELAARVDGALMDNILDYLNYVLVPALFLIEVDILPNGWDLVAAALILLASAYQFSQAEAKTEDHYFTGFPSYWNVLAIYLFLLGWNPWVNLAVVLTCVVLVFVPIKYIYPSRTGRNRKFHLVITYAWGLIGFLGLMLYPNVPIILIYFSLVLVGYYLLDSVLATLKSRRPS